MYNAFGFAIPLAITLVSTRYIVGKLTVDIYGLYVLALSVMGLISFFDLGFGQGIIKFISYYHAQHDTDRINKVIDVSLIIHLIMGVLGAILIYLPAELWARHIFHVREENLHLAVTSLKIVAVGFFFNLLNGVFANIPKAFQRYDVAVKIQNGIFFGSTGAVVVSLYLGHGLFGALIATLCFQILGIIANGFFSYKLFPFLKIRLRFDAAVFKEIFKFSAFMALNVLTGNIVTRVDKIIVGRYLGMQGISYYNISFMVAQMGSAFIGAITQQLFPKVSSLQGANEHSQLTALYQKACRYTFLVAFILTTLLIMLGDSFVGLWMGNAFAEKAKIILPILAVVFFFSSITSAALWFYTGLGYTHINLISSAIGSACYLIGAVYLIPRYGFLGTALAFSLILIPFPLYHGYLLRYVLKMGIGWYLSLLARNLALIEIVLLAKRYMPAVPSSILAIVTGGLIITMLCLFLSHLFRLIDLREIREIIGKFRINRSEEAA